HTTDSDYVVSVRRNSWVVRDTPLKRCHILNEKRYKPTVKQRQFPLDQCSICTTTFTRYALANCQTSVTQPCGIGFQRLGTQGKSAQAFAPLDQRTKV